MKRTPPGDVFTDVVTTGLLLGGLLEQAGDALTAPDGQSGARWKVLGIVSKCEMTVAEIARLLRLSRQGVQKVADLLTEEGLTAYLDNPTDRRAKLLALTNRGREILSAIQTRQCRWANHMGEKFESGELVGIKAAIQKLIAVLSDSD
jgi:DNA-binding MarR family transcriptional regulator